MAGNFPGLSNIEAILRQIAVAVNGLITNLTDLVASTDDEVVATNSVATAITAAFPPPLTSSTTWNPASLLTLTQDTTTIACSGATLGKSVLPSFSLDLQGMTLTGYVSASDIVTVVLWNGTAGTLNLSSGTLKVRVYS